MGNGNDSFIRREFVVKGYYILRNAIPEELLIRLRESLEPMRAKRWTQDDRNDNLLRPDCFHPSFLDFLNLPVFNQAVEEITNTKDLAVGGLAVLMGHLEQHTWCKWHRDFEDEDPRFPALLARPNYFVQFNAPVYDDPSLSIVPGSHNRYSTPEEIDHAHKYDCYDTIRGPFNKALAFGSDPVSGMPGVLHVPLKAGDIALYTGMTWHSADLRPEWKRATLHGRVRDVEVMRNHEFHREGLRTNLFTMDSAYMGDKGPYFGPQLDRFNQFVREYVPEAEWKKAVASNA